MSDDRDSSDGASFEERLASSGDRHEIKTVIAGATIALGGNFLAMARDPAVGLPIAWSSSDPAIATVSAEGLVHTHAPGNVVILAMSARHSRTIKLRVGAADFIPEPLASDHSGGRKAARWISLSAATVTATLGLILLAWGLAAGLANWSSPSRSSPSRSFSSESVTRGSASSGSASSGSASRGSASSGSASNEDGGQISPPVLDSPSISIASVALLGPSGPIDGTIGLFVGESTTLRAQATTETGELVVDADVIIRSSDPAVASFLGGVLRGRAVGEAVISTQIAGVDFSSVLVLIRSPRPAPPPLPPTTIASVALAGGTLVLYEGDSVSVPSLDVRDEEGAPVLNISPALAVTDPQIGRIASGGWLVGLEPGSSWLTAEVGTLRDSVPLEVTPVPVEITTVSRLELPVGSSLITPVTSLDRRGNTIPEADLVWSSLTPDLVQVDRGTGRMLGLNSGVGRVVVSSRDFNVSDTITVLVISVVLAPPLQSPLQPPPIQD